MLLPLQGANPNIHRPRALPWAVCLLAFQAVTPLLVYRTPIICFSRKDAKGAKPYVILFFSLKYSCTQTAQNTLTFYGRTQVMKTT